MIQTVRFKNFKALRDVSIDLERFTVLVGPNASGKTSALEGLHYLSQAAFKDLSQILSGPRAAWFLVSKGGGRSLSIEAEGVWGVNRGRVEISATLPDQRAGADGSQSESGGGYIQRWLTADEAPDSPPGSLRNDPEISNRVGSAVMLHLNARNLGAPAHSDEIKPRLEFDGVGLAAVLGDMALSEPDEFDLLQEHVREVIPCFERIRLERVRVHVKRDSFDEEEWGHRITLDLKGAEAIPAHLASEGTLLAIGIVTALVQSRHAKLILLDDLDRGLHPRALGDLITALRRVLASDSEMQIVATSHSPYLLDNMEPTEIRLTSLDEAGATQCAALVDHPDFEKWKDEMSPGEFWSMVGEDWVVNRDGNAAGDGADGE